MMSEVSDLGTRAGRHGDSQDMPVKNDSKDIQSLVIEDIVKRRELGIERYGTALQADNGRDACLDAYEEVIDLAMYLKQHLVERDNHHTIIAPGGWCSPAESLWDSFPAFGVSRGGINFENLQPKKHKKKHHKKKHKNPKKYKARKYDWSS